MSAIGAKSVGRESSAEGPVIGGPIWGVERETHQRPLHQSRRSRRPMPDFGREPHSHHRPT